MKVVMHSDVAAPSLVRRYQFAAQWLVQAGIECAIRTCVDPQLVVMGADVLVSHNWIPIDVRERIGLRCYGGKPMTRPEHLMLLNAMGFPTMEWTTVSGLNEALALFNEWNVDRLILKRSFTGNGRGFHLLTPDQPTYGAWDFERDVICKEVNPNCGKVFKAELFGGKLMLGFVLKKDSLASRLVQGDTCPKGFRQLMPYRDDTERPDSRHRDLWEFTETEKEALEDLSLALTELGFGYVSVDLMRRPDDQLVAIEINTGSVTTWWSEQFPIVRERFTASLLNLVQQN